MRRRTIRSVATAAAFGLGLYAVPTCAAGFDEGSFESGGDSATTSPAPIRTPAGGGGFDDSSFEPGGASDPAVIAPPPNGGTIPAGDDFPGGTAQPDMPPPDTVVMPEGGGAVPTPPVPGPNTGPAGGIDPQITAFETRDFGVPPQNSLRQGQFHARTPTAVPGGHLLTTGTLVDAINSGTRMVIIDVLGSGYGLPNAYNAPAMASAGSFNDRVQQQAAAWLQQITQGNRDMPLVIYCSDPMCWLSYNASLRAIAAGYGQVYWYRGGITAWQMAGLPMRPGGF